jgi:hypothetical protein
VIMHHGNQFLDIYMVFIRYFERHCEPRFARRRNYDKRNGKCGKLIRRGQGTGGRSNGLH